MIVPRENIYIYILSDCTSIETSFPLPLVSVYFITLNRARGMSFNGIISIIPILFLHFHRGLLYNGYPAISWHAVQSDLLIRPGTKKSLFCGFPMLLCKWVTTSWTFSIVLQKQEY